MDGGNCKSIQLYALMAEELNSYNHFRIVWKDLLDHLANNGPKDVR